MDYLLTFSKLRLGVVVYCLCYRQKPTKVSFEQCPDNLVLLTELRQTSTMMDLAHRALMDIMADAIQRLKKVKTEEKSNQVIGPNMMML